MKRENYVSEFSDEIKKAFVKIQKPAISKSKFPSIQMELDYIILKWIGFIEIK